jgi:L-histidine Nalpha-methyltransferase
MSLSQDPRSILHVTPLAKRFRQGPVNVADSVARAALRGLSATPKTLPPWLFYDDEGSLLFEQITELPEYYLTRKEREILEGHALEVMRAASARAPLTVVELGAGTAVKTDILLRALSELQSTVVYQPIDVSGAPMRAAQARIEASLPRVKVIPQVTDYTAGKLTFVRPTGHQVLIVYLGSSIGNFSPHEAATLLQAVRHQLSDGDQILLGTDLRKSKDQLLPAYDDAAGVTAAFNRNMLTRLNRELHTNFDLGAFEHRAIWNSAESRMEMHLVSTREQCVTFPARNNHQEFTLRFAAGETIHTENSYKFTQKRVAGLMCTAGFRTRRTWRDPQKMFCLTLASIPPQKKQVFSKVYAGNGLYRRSRNGHSAVAVGKR